MPSSPDRDPGFRRVTVFLVGLTCVLLAFDIWDIAAGEVDLNRHIPFLYPLVLLAFVGIVRYIERAYRALTPSEREGVPEEVGRASFLHADHLPKGRTEPGRFE